MSDYFRQHCVEATTFSSNKSWSISSAIERDIKNKVEAVGKPLKEWNIQINRGILTGFNEAFIIDKTKRDFLVDKSPKNVEIIRPILRGRDIQRFYYDKSEQYLLFIPWHFPLHDDINVTGVSAEAEKMFAQLYPDIYSHLLSYKEQLAKRNKAETGIRYEWYALQRYGANYWQLFEQPKIIYPEITKFINFTYDYDGHYFVNNKCFIMTGECLEYLTCFFNSKLFRYCFLNNFPELLGGTRELRKIFFQEIPVMPISEDDNKTFKVILKEIMTAKKSELDSSMFEEKMNNLLYKYYNLDEAEIDAVNAFDIIWRSS